MAIDSSFWTVQAEDFQKNVLSGTISSYNRHPEQSVCNLTTSRTLPPVFPGQIFENRLLWTAASEHSKIAASNAIRFLTVKISFEILLSDNT